MSKNWRVMKFPQHFLVQRTNSTFFATSYGLLSIWRRRWWQEKCNNIHLHEHIKFIYDRYKVTVCISPMGKSNVWNLQKVKEDVTMHENSWEWRNRWNCANMCVVAQFRWWLKSFTAYPIQLKWQWSLADSIICNSFALAGWFIHLHSILCLAYGSPTNGGRGWVLVKSGTWPRTNLALSDAPKLMTEGKQTP